MDGVMQPSECGKGLSPDQMLQYLKKQTLDEVFRKKQFQILHKVAYFNWSVLKGLKSLFMLLALCFLFMSILVLLKLFFIHWSSNCTLLVNRDMCVLSGVLSRWVDLLFEKALLLQCAVPLQALLLLFKSDGWGKMKYGSWMYHSFLF